MLHVLIVDLHRVLFEGQAQCVQLPGEQGFFEVWPLHRPLVSRLLPGFLVVDGRMLPIQRGIVKVARDALTAIVETA